MFFSYNVCYHGRKTSDFVKTIEESIALLNDDDDE